ncbi:MAG: hypothetical protein FWE71_08395 [Nocardioidaceae bacterium]|nr:hypothetical protein [Nocardioidaceae bacterium]MCL2614897.1 hypothetical protein [Nocardioidaceae bacterium]
MRWLLRLTVAVVTLLLGASVSLFTVALHGYWWGLALGLAATAATLVALPGGWARLPFGIGWSALVVLAMPTRPEGDVVIVRDPAGWVLLTAAVVVVICAMIGTRSHTPVPPPEGRDLASR